MASKQITVGVGIPMIIVGALIALLWAPAEVELRETVEFVGSLIGILGVVFFRKLDYLKYSHQLREREFYMAQKPFL